MTREVAKSILYVYRAVNLVDVGHREAFDMAIKALSSSEVPNTCGDVISRQAVLDGLASIAKAKARSDAQKSLMGRVMFFTEQLPSVTPQQKNGHWFAWRPEDDVWRTTCSECGEETRTLWDYCPHCGAKMEVKE